MLSTATRAARTPRGRQCCKHGGSDSSSGTSSPSHSAAVRRWCFFFSSRRRHTRFDCDWSSDVCSSDLEAYPTVYYPGSMATSHAAVVTVEAGAELAGIDLQLVRAHGVRVRGRITAPSRSEERRVGEEWRSRGAPDH